MSPKSYDIPLGVHQLTKKNNKHKRIKKKGPNGRTILLHQITRHGGVVCFSSKAQRGMSQSWSSQIPEFPFYFLKK